MTLARFLVGIPLLVVAVGSVAAASVVARRRLVPGWKGLDALLVDCVLTLSVLTVSAEVLGTFGLFRMRPLLVLCIVLGVVAWRTGSPAEVVEGPPEQPTECAPDRSTSRFARWKLAVAAGAVTLFIGSWLSRTLTAIDQGITTVDSHWYHLPFAINFLQSGHTWGIHFTDPVTAYFPATSSQFHAIGMMFFRTDLLSTVMNLGWLALVILAGWCIGRPFGVAPVTALGPAILFGGPGMVETQPGGALTDVVGCALFLAAVAIALVPRVERNLAPDVIAAMAAGLSTGAKFTFLPAAGALCIGLIVISPPGRRVRRTLGVIGGAAATGGYWYLRNLVIIGNPLPSIGIGIGPFALPQVKGSLPSATVLSFLRNDEARSDFLVSGLRDALGPVWPAVLLLAIVGAVGAIRQSDPRLRMLGLVAMTSNVAYLVTPQFIMDGYFFATNFRYAAPGVVLGLVLFAIVCSRYRTWTLPAFAGVLVVTQMDPVSWSFGFGGQTFFVSVDDAAALRGGIAAVLLVAIVAAGTWLWRRSPRPRLTATAFALGVPTLVLVGLATVHGRYLDGRYRGPMPFPELTEYSRDLRNADIGVHGPYIYLKSPFSGLDLSNRVQYLYVELGNGNVREPATCDEWIDLLEEGAYDHVFMLGIPAQAGPIQWTAAQPDARLVATDVFPDGEARAYELEPTTRRSCPDGTE